MKPPAPAAVILLSGGLDSATTLAMARAEGFAAYVLSFRYGQRHQAELRAARAVAKALGAVEHREIDIDLGQLGGSALTADLPVPRHRPQHDMASGGIPTTYVPARNTIFLSFALAWCEVLPAAHIFIGVNALDYSGYPDCRPEYVLAFQHLARLATRIGAEGGSITVHAPLLQLTKAEIIRRGIELGVDYGLTLSCYDPDSSGTACGACDACLIRLTGFRDAGLQDPVSYRTEAAR